MKTLNLTPVSNKKTLQLNLVKLVSAGSGTDYPFPPRPTSESSPAKDLVEKEKAKSGG
jgi:hypothetical protein